MTNGRSFQDRDYLKGQLDMRLVCFVEGRRYKKSIGRIYCAVWQFYSNPFLGVGVKVNLLLPEQNCHIGQVCVLPTTPKRTLGKLTWKKISHA